MSESFRIHRRTSRAISTGEAVRTVSEPPAWRRLLLPPDPLQMDAGAEGELIVARVRTILIVLLLPIPIINLLFDPFLSPGLVGLGICLLALGLSVAAQQVLKRNFYRPWLGLATSLLDVSLVSAGLAAFLFLDEPITAVNSRLLFEVYFVAIGATALRYDARISVAAGVVAMAQYGILVAVAQTHWDLTDPGIDPRGYGSFDWATQISRVLLLAVFTLLAAAIVLRSQRLRRQSRSDRLTGLPNRSYFDERVLAELSRARRYHEPVALAMIDVDHFKQFNDRWGHAAGDVALRLVARAILAAIRQSDLVVRYGGEEFVALFPGMDSAAAMDRVEEIRRAVEALPLPIPRRKDVARVTISIGLASYGFDGTQAEDLLDRADARLFEAKEKGRNRVVGPPADARRAEPPGRRSGDHVEDGQAL
jgi:two-component system cell cycle response regulator